MNEEFKKESKLLTERLRNRDIPNTITLYGDGCEYQIPLGQLCEEAADRIEELESNNRLARDKFFTDNSDGKAASEMLRTLLLIDDD
jgi:hypothetical protein